jgi:hypothetical protein
MISIAVPDEWGRVTYYAAKADDIKAKKKAYRAAEGVKAREATYNKAYHDAKAHDLNAKNKAYRAAKADYLKARRLAIYATNSHVLKARSTAYYFANIDHCKAQMKVYRQTKLGCVECKDWPDWRIGLPQYDNYCYRCFCEKFPTHEKVRTKARVEIQIRAFIDSNFADFVHDRPMHTAHCDCNHTRRVDHRRVVGNTLLCIETDEHAHRGYDQDDEQARYHDVLLAWGGKLCFVRLNPDGYGPPIAERLDRLHAEITRHIGRLERGENMSWLEVYHLYYPEGTPDFYEEALGIKK